MNRSRAEQTASSDVYSGCLGLTMKVDYHILNESLLLVPNSDHQWIEPGLGVWGV